MNKYELLISDLAQHLTVFDLELSVNETCQAVINDRYNVNIEVSTNYDSIFLYWQLALSDTILSEDVLHKLLSFGYMGLATNGAFFSINKSDELIFCRRVNSEELTSLVFTKIFDGFVDAIIYCDKEVSRLVKSSEVAVSLSHNVTSEDFFLRV
ncbi:hypothetical protein A9Q99_22305 [Gammaproteobacteria bacterium 45_16_T64]|nr:hypothetical protein A9Q99_22305 [Gammaproteobacteria bacterium 45_16_T64]